jgi:hypothetical protein
MANSKIVEALRGLATASEDPDLRYILLAVGLEYEYGRMATLRSMADAIKRIQDDTAGGGVVPDVGEN